MFDSRTAIAALAAATLALCACKDAPKRAGTPDAGAAAAAGPGVRIVVDGVDVATVRLDDLATRRPLVDFLPAEHRDLTLWARVTAHGQGNRRLLIPKPGGRDAVPAMYRSLKGKPSFGLFRTAALAAGEPQVFELDVVDVEVTTIAGEAAAAKRIAGRRGGSSAGEGGGTSHGADEPAAPGSADLAIRTGAGEPIALTAAELDALPPTLQPSGDADKLGFALADLLAARQQATPRGVRLVDDEGTALELTPAELGASYVAFFKRNRQGAWRFKLFHEEQPGDWQVTKEARGVVEIEVR